jgi:hypothetical protein
VAVRDVFRRIFRPTPTSAVSSDSGPEGRGDGRTRERELAAAWMAAMETGELRPPRDVHDGSAWDRYWTSHLKVGPVEQGFNDMMSSDDELVATLRRREARSILCVGNGMSTEALSLALHGFQVTALEISSVVCSRFAESLKEPEHLASKFPGFRVDGDVLIFGDSGPIPQELCPKIHRNDAHPPKAGGRLTFVCGDLSDPAMCAGPFDVVIERRTVQLFPEEERETALDRLAARLSERGMFVSHMHDGGGGPGRHRPHHAREWAKARGFVVGGWRDAETEVPAARVARIHLSTG